MPRKPRESSGTGIYYHRRDSPHCDNLIKELISFLLRVFDDCNVGI
jgi:hypothetical protein